MIIQMTSRLSESLNKFLFPLLHTNRVVPSLPNLTALFWRNLTSSSFISSSCNPKLFQSGAAGIQCPAGAVCPLGLWGAGLKVRHIHRLKLSKRTNMIFSSPSIDSQLLREASEFPDTELRALEILSSMDTQGKEKLPWVLLHGCYHWLSHSPGCPGQGETSGSPWEVLPSKPICCSPHLLVASGLCSKVASLETSSGHSI